MARGERERESKGGSGVSLAKDDAIQVGIFGPGPAKIVESVFADYNYGGATKGVPVWLITYDRDGEKYEQPYSVGSGWRVSSDGSALIPKNGQTGLPDSCNAMLLVASLEEANFPNKLLKSGDPRVLEGMEVVLKREAQPDRGLDGAGSKKNDKGGGRQVKTILLVDEIVSLPGEDKASGKKKAAADVDEDDEEKPVAKKRSARDEDDEDEKPAKAKAKGKADADDEEPSEEDGVEALVDALEAADDNTIEIDDVEMVIKKQLKGQDNAKAMAAYVGSDDFLSLEKGWSVNAKKGIVTLDEPPKKKR